MFKLGENMNDLKIDFKKFTLHNGLSIILLKRNSKFFNLNFGIKIGSAYESEDERGFSHFVEHMLFKSNLKFNNYDINRILEFLGGDYNAFTDYGSTVFTLTGVCSDIEKSLELLSSMIMYPKFDEKEILVEKDVIISEMDSCISDYEEYSFIRTNEEAFSTSYLKFDIAGTKDSIEGIDRHALYGFYEKYYVPNNSYVVIISPYDEELIVNLLDRYFGSWQTKAVSHIDVLKESNISQKIVTLRSDLELSTITYLFTFNNLRQQDRVPLKIASYKLGNGSNSILFEKIREKMGLAYDVYTQIELSDEFEGMYIFCSTNYKNVGKVIKIIDKCIESMKICNHYFDNYNLQLMKKLQLMSVYSTIEDNEKLGMYLIDKMICNKDINEYINDLLTIDRINSNELMNICSKYFKNPTIHILKGK